MERRHTVPDHPDDCTADSIFVYKNKNKAIQFSYWKMALLASEGAGSEQIFSPQVFQCGFFFLLPSDIIVT